VLACETGALAANEVVPELGAALVLGQLVDRIVGAYVVSGRVPDDPYGSAVESLKAERSERTLAWLDAATPEVLVELREDLAHRASRVRESWPAIDPAWWPRPEDSARLPFADGRLLLSGRFDLLLGGRATDLPRLLVEVKSGSATGVHQPDLYWYALLAAMRDGAAPRCVVVWTAADGLTTTAPISADGLRSAAMRLIAAAERWATLLTGRPPTLTAHPGCRWCALLDACTTGQGWQPDGATDDHWLDDEAGDDDETADDA
jgi:PD-(D/E)XK nuclease superfamily